MFAVIFKAKIKSLDEEYFSTAEEMRNLAFEKYGCKGFDSCSEDDFEIAISYWESKEQINAWKNDKDHKIAQINGITKWYESYRVQIVEILHGYKMSGNRMKNKKGDMQE